MSSSTLAIGNRGLNTVITRFFGTVARAYDAAPLQHFVYRPPQDEMVAELRAAGSRRIADIGCGTGILTTRIQRELRPEAVYGIDASTGMLAQARARSTEVTWLKSAAEHLPLDDGALDAVVTTSAFHFFDHPVALREFHRVLAPGGLVAIATMLPNSPTSGPIQRLTRSTLSPAHAPSEKETRKLLEDAGFEVVKQRKIHRPMPQWLIPDGITVGRRR
ncbi:class I SAM-dependent methyltransferase [Nocardia huaxiensis]|uniref:Methyltransferase domain-containing protein n=1 Tax=Nocardia huaxiensis TaxID=2755382 RepID=A0A7D6ZVG3_9NOCA|nr:class I SAM-dependent methyltransferase [Nocardia huaxiensis]QLY29689.1 methyltransferase domain-containing protein [Nocardia huaxiensis]UFS96736.1 methyltransferase domain-containing protein [Nocardia huaxiensis]